MKYLILILFLSLSGCLTAKKVLEDVEQMQAETDIPAIMAAATPTPVDSATFAFFPADSLPPGGWDAVYESPTDSTLDALGVPDETPEPESGSEAAPCPDKPARVVVKTEWKTRVETRVDTVYIDRYLDNPIVVDTDGGGLKWWHLLVALVAGILGALGFSGVKKQGQV